MHVGKSIAAFIVAVMIAPCAAFGGKTEVSVTSGRVEAVTEQGEVTVSAGHKAVLSTQVALRSQIADPIVKDITALTEWLDMEREAGGIRIDNATIQVYQIDGPDSFKGAAYVEIPNETGEKTNELRFGPTSCIPVMQFFDMRGNVLEYDVEQTDTFKSMPLGYITLRFLEMIPAGEDFRFILLGESIQHAEVLRKEGGVWGFSSGNDSRWSLNYYQVILPESAILVGWDQPIELIESREGRTVVTMRNYTGDSHEGHFTVFFLWPERDHTSIEDLHEEFRSVGFRQAE